MTTRYLKEQVEKLKKALANDETLRVIDEVLNLSVALPQTYNEVLLQRARFVRTEREERKGTLTPETASVQKNKINHAILGLLDEIISTLPSESSPIASPSIETETQTSPVLPEKILGINNLKQISWLARGLECAKSVCRIHTPSGLGTGFLIQHNLLMTNNHVIPDIETAKGTVIEFNYQFAFDGNIEPTFRYRLDSTRFHTSIDLDYTIVGVFTDSGNRSLSEWGTLHLNPNADPVRGELVSIIQHPNGGLKQIVVSSNNVVQIKNPYLLYTTDTMGGSSGSPVFNDAWQVIAIHHAATENLNEGILMSHVKLDAESHDLWP